MKEDKEIEVLGSVFGLLISTYAKTFRVSICCRRQSCSHIEISKSGVNRVLFEGKIH